MSLFSAFFGCFMRSSSQVSDDHVGGSGSCTKECSSELKPKSKSKSSGGPILVSYFPVSSNLSRL
ncbi:hypothetical protein I3843_13G031900 [Carya illinoinensis]|uniref:Uncharacterized protein n=1 Tax=Carya illinoinensis TaxID=32201 RepID=A0A8T1NPG7_CARIL|nr:hypothetical protein CIPAW_13G035100 [Carya illinoinensis]KAG6680303.1 hypothetical protein I3842_13G035400 [Carya illinoinensis]KAG7948884.1 hypothetical protein I3843_13G031900 [Carya illinoinensis]